MNIIVTGPKGFGKSFTLIKSAEKLKASGRTLGGVISRSVWKGSERLGYEIVHPAALNASGGDGALFLCGYADPQQSAGEDWFVSCHHVFSKSSFAKGNEWIRAGLECDVLFIDEIGGLEMSAEGEQGWDLSLPLTGGGAKKRSLLFSVKELILDTFIRRYDYGWKVFRAEPNKDISDLVVAELHDA
jgi:nucleoside-triphosphatase THEP1